MEKSEYTALAKKAEKLDLTDEERKKIAGSFISLPGGNTHYEMKGEGGTGCTGSRLRHTVLHIR